MLTTLNASRRNDFPAPARSAPGLPAALALALLAAAAAGCGATAPGLRWGHDATFAPGWERIRIAAVRAATSPGVWAPAAGALAFRAAHADRQLSDWAVRTAPVYGTASDADRMSDRLLIASGAIFGGTGLAAPGGDRFADWASDKTKGFAVEGFGGLALWGTVEAAKGGADRTRPNREDRESFPSGHSAAAALLNTYSSRHLDALGLSPASTTASRIGLGTLTAATAWARVEAGEHYPSDVLAGMALGRFFAVFFDEAFLGPQGPPLAAVVEPSREGVLFTLTLGF